MRTVLGPVPGELKKLNKMKKYRTTGKHPELKEGIVIHYEESSRMFYTESRFFEYHQTQKDYALEKGYIEEIQEPEFTKADMIDFCYSFAEGNLMSADYEKGFEEWLNKRK